MQELSGVLNKAANDDGSGAILELDAAAAKWAQFCLHNFCGELLKRGLRVSRAIADFTVELQQKEVK